MNFPSVFLMKYSCRLWGRASFALIMAVLIAGGCSAPESKKKSVWVKYAQTDDYEFFYDRGNIEQRDADIVRVLLKRQPRGETPVIPETKQANIREMKKRQKAGMSIQGYENWDHEEVLCEIDCRRSVIRFLKSINYDHKGNALDTIVVPESVLKWDNVIPGTINDVLGQTVCRQ
jgi:hypothetical protein